LVNRGFLKLTGCVVAPKSIELSGANYTVTIDLAQIPDRLRWGMTALVQVGK
jgi:hypothetical protein